MHKIPTLFKRDERTHLVVPEVTPGCEWVLAGEGVATRKWDGTACLIRNGKLYKRYDAKAGRQPPPGFEPAQPEPDPVTGHWPGWVPVGDGPDDRYHREAFSLLCAQGLARDGTYELCGPKVNGNPEGLGHHVLIPHGIHLLADCPRSFDGLREWLKGQDIEGIVWWHPDGRMAKLKKKDFGMGRKD